MPDANAADELRAGSLVLALFANPLNALILRAHADGPLRLAQMHEKVGWAAETSLRATITNLRQIGALGKLTITQPRFAVENELTPAGRELLFVADVVEAWLAQAPGGPIALESDAAKGAIRALLGGWNSTLMRALATRPLTLTELDSLILATSYPGLERRLAKMRASGLIEPVEGEGRGTPYVVTEWLRRSIAPLCAAGRCECRHMKERGALIANLEVEAAFMLLTPLVSLPESTNGTCALAVQTEIGDADDRGHSVAGVTVQVECGKPIACVIGINPGPPTWALGTAETWLDAVIDGQFGDLRLGGARPELALALVNGMRLASASSRNRRSIER